MIEVMVTAFVLGVLGYFVVSLFQSSLKSSTQSNVSLQADTFKRNLINNLANDAAWANTVNASAALANASPAITCLKPLYANPPSAATCPVGTSTSLANSIVVMNGGPGGGTLIYDNSSAQNGFTSAGAPCPSSSVPSGFSPTGNDLCPFQMNLTVRVTCAASPCSLPQVELIGVLTYSPVNQAFKVALNTARYGFDFIRGQQADSLQAACTMLGATFTAGPPPDCTLNYSTLCNGLGGNWTNQSCQIPPPPPPPPAPPPPPPPPAVSHTWQNQGVGWFASLGCYSGGAGSSCSNPGQTCASWCSGDCNAYLGCWCFTLTCQ